MKKFKEVQELKHFYWDELCFELYNDAEKEVNPSYWQRFTGVKEMEIKELQRKKFDKLFNKLLKQKEDA